MVTYFKCNRPLYDQNAYVQGTCCRELAPMASAKTILQTAITVSKNYK